MISLAIALVLILGIEQVFSITSKTVGAGQALSTANRDDRALHTILSADFQNAVGGSDAPCFLIRSSRVYAFNTRGDKSTAADPTKPETDPAFGANGIPTTSVNYRSHRIDRIAFFERGLFQRQTGGDDIGNLQFISPNTSYEAYTWLGHLALPNNAALKTPSAPTNKFFEPGDTDALNDNNAFATDWILGRMNVLLVPTPALSDTSYIKAVTPDTDLTPLAYSSVSYDGKGTLITASRYDQAKTSIASYSSSLQNYIGTTPVWNPTTGKDWYQKLIGNPLKNLPTTGFDTHRFHGIPFVTKPITNSSMATAAPIFVRGCTHFIVEYAGNFYTKNPDGTFASAAQDPSGTLDFSQVGGVNGPKHIRWYGYPRDTNGDGKIDSLNDVVPLRDVIGATTFERFSSDFPSAGTTDYAAWGGAAFVTPPTAEYVAAWGPATTEALPKMIRITIGIDDANGNLSSSQMYEYIFNVGQ